MQSGTDAIQIRNLSVSYSVVADRSDKNGRKSVFRSTERRLIHALNDVSFDVPAGRVVALIGGNGAGKSTLLKTIVGVLKPASGHIDLYGRPHLLAPGMGFNRRLSGRENVVLGALAGGMSLDEVREKQDQIIEFADIGGFIDMPTTTYSSGMFGRLAFAVATHIDTEILLIDEALSAGDAGFRERAIDKVREMCGAAKTIVVVSHSSSMVEEMATHAVWLHQGQVRRSGELGDIADDYAAFQAAGGETAQMDRSIADR
ncbi:MAG: ABC transporter ATP-binding protein [Ilumatobacter sp.]|nr:ABC transporter ATP-binding protein [Ilumatobacter sp.]